MADKTPAYVNVDELMRQVGFEQAVAYYGIQLPEMRRVGDEIRMRCFLNCGRKEETGDRALAVQADHPAKIWRCHQYGCGKGGNLVSLCDMMKPGTHADGKPRGERFKAILADLRAMAAGVVAPATREPQSPSMETSEAKAQAEKPPAANLPLAQSANQRARTLVNLDAKFIVDVAQVSPKAAAYFRSRSFFTPETCRRWRVGYLPRDTGGDHGGGTMRGKIVYPMLSEQGEVLTWFGRDPEYEARHHEWLSGGKEGREPEKFHFVKGFHRGLELFGQHRLREEGIGEKVRELGLVVVEGPNDVVALDTLDVPAVGLCSNTITKAQAAKLARYAEAFGRGIVTLMLDCDSEGEAGTRHAAVELAQLCAVRFAWLPSMYGGRFKGRQPESLKSEEWQSIRELLVHRADRISAQQAPAGGEEANEQSAV